MSLVTLAFRLFVAIAPDLGRVWARACPSWAAPCEYTRYVVVRPHRSPRRSCSQFWSLDGSSADQVAGNRWRCDLGHAEVHFVVRPKEVRYEDHDLLRVTSEVR